MWFHQKLNETLRCTQVINKITCCQYLIHWNCISDVMVSVLISSAVDRELNPDWVKPKTMKLVFVASPLSTQY